MQVRHEFFFLLFVLIFALYIFIKPCYNRNIRKTQTLTCKKDNSFIFGEKIKAVRWLDRFALTYAPPRYGEQLVVKVAKIEV